MAQTPYSPTFDDALSPLDQEYDLDIDIDLDLGIECDLVPLPESSFKTDTVTEAELLEVFSNEPYIPPLPSVSVSWPEIMCSDVSDTYLRERREIDIDLHCDEEFDNSWEDAFKTPPRKRKRGKQPMLLHTRPLRSKKKIVVGPNPKSRKKLVF